MYYKRWCVHGQHVKQTSTQDSTHLVEIDDNGQLHIAQPIALEVHTMYKTFGWKNTDNITSQLICCTVA